MSARNTTRINNGVKRKNFTQIDNAVLDNRALSSRALGILARILRQHPEHTKITALYLADRMSEGIYAVLSGLEELEGHGYLVRRKYHGRDGRWVHEAWVSDVPADLDEYRENTQVRALEVANVQVRPGTGFPHVVDPIVKESKTRGSKTLKTADAVPAQPRVPRKRTSRAGTAPATGRRFGSASAKSRSDSRPAPDSAAGLSLRFAELVREREVGRVPEDYETGILGRSFKKKLQDGDDPDTIRALQDAWFNDPECRRRGDKPQALRFLNAIVRLRNQTGTSDVTDWSKEESIIPAATLERIARKKQAAKDAAVHHQEDVA